MELAFHGSKAGSEQLMRLSTTHNFSGKSELCMFGDKWVKKTPHNTQRLHAKFVNAYSYTELIFLYYLLMFQADGTAEQTNPVV